MSSIFLQAISLISVPPGNLAYHLVIMFVLDAMALVAIGAGRRFGWNAAIMRLSLASGGTLVGQFALVMTALLTLIGVASPDRLLPPMERFVNVASIGLLMWAFIPLVDEFPQIGAGLAIGNLIISGLAYLVFAVAWYDTSSPTTPILFNGSFQDRVWTIWALALLGLASLALAARRRDNWGLIGAAWAALFVSHFLHLSIDELNPLAPGWVRLGNLVTYPLMAGIMLRRITGGVQDDLRRETPGAVALGETIVPWQALEACRRVIDASDLKAALQRATLAINTSLDAGVVAVGMIPTGKRLVDLVAVQQAGLRPRPGASFDLDSQPVIQRAVAWQQPVIAALPTAESIDPDLATLRALLGDNSGLLYIHPLVYEHELSGLLIAGFTKAEEELSPTTKQLLSVIASELATAIAQRRRVEYLTNTLAQREEALRRLNDEATRLTSRLTTRLSESQSKWENERAKSAARLREVEAALAQARSELAAMRAGGQPAAKQAGISPLPPSPSEPPQAEDKVEVLAYREQFFEEATKHLDTIASALKRLKGTRDEEAMSQLFRSAHTLKHIAATMNYPMMARLSGILGDAAKRLRVGGMEANSDLPALSEDTLHVLRVLLEDIRTGLEPSVDVAPLLERWRLFMTRTTLPQVAGTGATDVSVARSQLQVRLELSPECQLKAVRAMVILAQLRRIGKVLACRPQEQTLRSGHVEGEFVVTLATNRSPAEVQTIVTSVPDVAKVDIQ